MKDTYVDGEKLARNGQKTANYYSVSFTPHYRRILILHLLVFNLWFTYVVQKYENEQQKTKQVLIPIPNAKTRNKDVEV